MLRHVSTSVRRHQGAHLFLAKITCVTSVVIDYSADKIHQIVKTDKKHKIHVVYTILKMLVCKIVFDLAVYTIVSVLLLCVSCVD